MAKKLWGKVYFKDQYAGILQEESGERTSFTYDLDYLSSSKEPISTTLPLQKEPHLSLYGLLPFFDNLVSEGWLNNAQIRFLGKREAKKIELLLAFGFDCIGALSIIDPEPILLNEKRINLEDPKEKLVFESRSSLSGVQPKIPVILEKNIYRPTHQGELSTHIAKFSSYNHFDLIENECLATLALKTLLPHDKIVSLKIDSIKGLKERALLIERFDRKIKMDYQIERVHFEEFNQILNLTSAKKYSGEYKDMSDFILSSDFCMPSQAYILYQRILGGILIGNTDMHFKNFSLFKEEKKYQLTPSYDQVCAALYEYQTLALGMNKSFDLNIHKLKRKNIILLGKEFKLSDEVIENTIFELGKNLEKTKQTLATSKIGTILLRDKMIEFMEKIWKKAFGLTGKKLLKNQ